MPAQSYTQDAFSGGMNLVSLDTKVGSNQYIAGINVRTRFGYAEPIKAPVDITLNLPAGYTIQGLYAFGEFLVAFVGGFIWTKRTTANLWQPLVSHLSATATRIFCVAVPVTSMQYLRKSDVATPNTPNTSINLDATNTLGSEVCLVCQDGVSQPILIFTDGTAVVANDYNDWTLLDREYIPVGKQMAYFNGVLYIVAPNGNHVYRSVTGRPLDFVIAVDNNGDKVADAEPLSFAVDSNEIKLMAPLNNSDLCIITAYSAYSVRPSVDKPLLYGEPQFDQTYLFTAGTINQFCFADILGDFAFIDREGLKSFNSVQQTKFEGNNSVFSLSVAKLFSEIIQDDNACVGSFDNYTFFFVKTTYGNVTTLVYDNINKVFVSIDFLSTSPIKQAASTYSSDIQRFFICTDNAVYELYSPDATEPKDAVLFTRGIDSRNSDEGSTDGVYNIKTQAVRLIFEDSLEEGIVYIDELVNNSRQTIQHSRVIPTPTGGVLYPVLFPVMFTYENSVVPVDFPFGQARVGQKIAYVITWTGGAKLTYFVARTETQKSATSPQQQALVAA